MAGLFLSTIMALLPKRNLIEELIERGEIVQSNRPYIGHSSLGGSCHRHIWLNFRWAYERSIPKRIQRIFDRGHWAEERIVNDLIAAGIHVYGRQDELVDDTGHVKGHTDGIVTGLPGDEDKPYLLEIKTMNDKRFKQYLKEGLRLSNPKYWVQIHLYMGHLNIDKCLFIVENKDNEHRDYQMYDFDPNVYTQYKDIGFQILTSEGMPAKIGSQVWHECKMCDAFNYCHKQAVTVRNCRTCEFADIEMQGNWSCRKDGKILSVDEQKVGCDHYNKSEVYK